MSILRFLAIKILKVPLENHLGREMQKNLKEGELYSFFDGVCIDEEKIVLPEMIDIYNVNHTISVNISAIVGENGSGKSTLIDYALRILNNFSTYILGELYRSPGAEHLHYVFDVYAELYVQVGDFIFRITCEGNKLIVYRYSRKINDDSFVYTNEELEPLINEQFNPFEIIYEHKHLFNILGEFCYTIITNYSLYSLCTSNYRKENTQYKKENEIRKIGLQDGYKTKTLNRLLNDKNNGKGSITSYFEAQSWLQGLFVKNDGYQMPVVISPMRTYGRIDVQKEYKLAKERLLSMIFLQGTDGKHQFRKINGKLFIDGFSISKDLNEGKKYFNIDDITDFLHPLEPSLRNDICGIIRLSIVKILNIKDEQRDHSDYVWNYIIRKILKIIFTYPRYVTKRNYLLQLTKESQNISNEIDNIIIEVLHDHSHVTRKLFRSLYYLKYNHIKKKKKFKIEEYRHEILELLEKEKEQSPMYPQYIDELLPPPIFYVDFELFDINDISKKYRINFSSLSSGEKQITYTLSSFFYQLINIDSSGDVREIKEKEVGKNDIYQTNNKPIKYKHLCAIFDEIELYFHPEMQRLFVQNLLDGLNQINFRQIEGIHIILATHSPFILSDIPVQNVMFINKNGTINKKNDLCTFAANIHSMLKHSFFLKEGTMGEFARNTITNVQSIMNRYLLWYEFKELKEDSSDSDSQKEKLKNKFFKDKIYEKWIEGNYDYERDSELTDLKWVSNIIDIIQEPIIKTIMTENLNKWKNYVAIRDK